MDQQREAQQREHQRPSHRVLLVPVVAIVALLGSGIAGWMSLESSGRTPGTESPRAAPGPSRHALPTRLTARYDARQFVAALRAGDRAAALGHGTAEVYDRLVRDESGATAQVRLQHCARSTAGSAWTCGLDFPSTGPADGEAYSLTLTRSGSRWMATATDALAG